MEKIELSADNFRKAISGDARYLSAFQVYLAKSALKILEKDGINYNREQLIDDAVVFTLAKIDNSLGKGFDESKPLRPYMLTVLRNVITDLEYCEHKEKSLSILYNSDVMEKLDKIIKKAPNGATKIDSMPDSDIDVYMHEYDIHEAVRRILTYMKRQYGNTIYRILQVKNDWELEDSDREKIAQMCLGKKGNSYTTFLSQELNISPQKIRNIAAKYEKILIKDIPEKGIFTQEDYGGMMSMMTLSDMQNLFSRNYSDELMSELFCKLVFLQDHIDFIEQLNIKMGTNMEEIVEKHEIPYTGSETDYSSKFAHDDWNYLANYPAQTCLKNRKAIFNNLLVDNAYVLVLEKYLELFQNCWRSNDAKWTAEHLNDFIGKDCSYLFEKEDPLIYMQDMANYIINLPIKDVPDNVKRDFFHDVSRGKLEFASIMPVIDGYAAWDIAEAFNRYYEKGGEIHLERVKLRK